MFYLAIVFGALWITRAAIYYKQDAKSFDWKTTVVLNGLVLPVIEQSVFNATFCGVFGSYVVVCFFGSLLYALCRILLVVMKLTGERSRTNDSWTTQTIKGFYEFLLMFLTSNNFSLPMAILVHLLIANVSIGAQWMINTYAREPFQWRVMGGQGVNGPGPYYANVRPFQRTEQVRFHKLKRSKSCGDIAKSESRFFEVKHVVVGDHLQKQFDKLSNFELKRNRYLCTFAPMNNGPIWRGYNYPLVGINRVGNNLGGLNGNNDRDDGVNQNDINQNDINQNDDGQFDGNQNDINQNDINQFDVDRDDHLKLE